MIRIYNTLTRKKEILKSIRKKRIRPPKFFKEKFRRVNLFVCGPTVYDFSHIGHARTYIAFDVIVKYLRKRGLKVFYLQNITDIDDKIINRAKELGVNPKNLARRFEDEYYKDVRALKITNVDHYARATDHIPQIIKQIEVLVGNGYAYAAADGGVYFDISKFKDYGKLSHQNLKLLRKNVRIEPDPFKKGDFDFVLWKHARQTAPIHELRPKGVPLTAGTYGAGTNDANMRIFDGEPAWLSPWGWGRPGWHIEDTAITEHFFGPQYDIHGGGRDLIFPHHESEIAQMEAASRKKPMVKLWMHTGFLMVEGEKMAKSLGNFITIRDFLKKHPPEVLRFLVLATHYRSPLDYTKKMPKQVKASLERIGEFLDKLKSQTSAKEGANLAKKKKISGISAKIRGYSRKFQKEMDDDFNTPRALAVIFDLIKKVNPLINKGKLSGDDKKTILLFLKEVNEIFEILPSERKKIIPQEIQNLISQREILRKEKKWPEADEIRKQIEEMGYKIDDVPEGPKVKLIS